MAEAVVVNEPKSMTIIGVRVSLANMGAPCLKLYLQASLASTMPHGFDPHQKKH
jgi:hypothetical protein